MAIMVVLLPASEASQPALHPAAISELARLGVTSLAVVRDGRTVGIVVEGWAFDPGRSAEAVASAVGGRRHARTLQPLLEMAVSAASGGGEE